MSVAPHRHHHRPGEGRCDGAPVCGSHRTYGEGGRVVQRGDRRAFRRSRGRLATSASRDAENADEFVSRLRRSGRRAFGHPRKPRGRIVVLRRVERFSRTGPAVRRYRRRFHRLAFGRATASAGALVADVDLSAFRSFDIGCRRHDGTLLHGDPASDEEFARARAWAIDAFAPFWRRAVQAGPPCGRGGNANERGRRARCARVLRFAKVHKALVTLDDFRDVAHRLSAMPLSERRPGSGNPAQACGRVSRRRFDT